MRYVAWSEHLGSRTSSEKYLINMIRSRKWFRLCCWSLHGRIKRFWQTLHSCGFLVGSSENFQNESFQVALNSQDWRYQLAVIYVWSMWNSLVCILMCFLRLYKFLNAPSHWSHLNGRFISAVAGSLSSVNGRIEDGTTKGRASHGISNVQKTWLFYIVFPVYTSYKQPLPNTWWKFEFFKTNHLPKCVSLCVMSEHFVVRTDIAFQLFLARIVVCSNNDCIIYIYSIF